jgi:hypothetical protein
MIKLIQKLSTFSLILCLLPNGTAIASTSDLGLWNDGVTKQRIVNYVESVTKQGSPTYIPVQDRIAVFDNGGKTNNHSKRLLRESENSSAGSKNRISLKSFLRPTPA